jgi:gamma-glutamylcyclotransferase
VDTNRVVIFAYGSNMLAAQMLDRAPTARLAGAAFLERFVLRWNKRSNDGSGKCSVEETGRREDFVWGVLYELEAADKKKLDQIEGLGRGYGERYVNVLLQGRIQRSLTYYATSVDLTVRPYDWYKELVIAGAREHALPIEYIRTLEAVAAVTDSDCSRAAKRRQALQNR